MSRSFEFAHLCFQVKQIISSKLWLGESGFPAPSVATVEAGSLRRLRSGHQSFRSRKRFPIGKCFPNTLRRTARFGHVLVVPSSMLNRVRRLPSKLSAVHAARFATTCPLRPQKFQWRRIESCPHKQCMRTTQECKRARNL